jgi:UDPglucose 6-dehydrogenase
MEEAKKYFADISNDIVYCNDAYETTKDSDALVILTEWNQFRALDLEKVKNLLKNKIIIDLRNIYNPKELNEMGFKYYSIGRDNID